MEPFVFGVDLDGVCGDYTSAFRTIVARELGVAETELPLERSWDFREWGLGRAGGFEHLHAKAVAEDRMFATMPPIDGVTNSLWRLSDAGIHIRVITHRLYVNWGHASAVADTVEWLDAHRIPYRDICFLGNKPDVGADVYIDDGPHNIVQLRSAGFNAIVFDQPYNQDLDGPRARSWSELEDMVMSLAAERLGVIEQQLPGVDAGADRLDRRRET
ncbi:MAG: 5'-nucleotidase [Verrucomicrobiales bacterium]|jgi:5'-nucleotidase